MFSFLKINLLPAFEKVFLGTLIFYALFNALFLNLTTDNHQQFVYLADSFLHGQLSFREIPGSQLDLAWYGGKPYWHLGPFPAILLMPFVLLFGTAFRQGYVQFLLTCLNGSLLYLLALRLGIQKKLHALWLAFAYLFGSMFLAVAIDSTSWRFSQTIATTLVLVALFEYFGRKRFWLIGLLMALVFATRANILLGIAFFVLDIVFEKYDWKKKLRELVVLFAPVFFMGCLLLLYNYTRFNNLFENGYRLAPLSSLPEWFKNLEYTGKLFSLRYIPTNIYYYFLKGLSSVPLSSESTILKAPFITLDRHGFSVLLSAPFFIFVLLANTKEKIVRQAWVASVLILFTLLTYYISGFSLHRALSHRYFLDLTPFLYIMLIRALQPKLSVPVRILIVLSFALNFYLINTFS